MMEVVIKAENVSKSFTLHVQGAARIPVLSGLDFSLNAGECVALAGRSGSGKSTLMRMIYANYVCTSGRILVRHDSEFLDITRADPHVVLDIRRRTMGYVSQFLRVVPRVPTLQIVADPMIAAGHDEVSARNKARELLERLNIPEPLWSLSPVTFSGGEQQRVNIARGFAHAYPILLLDEPTASLDHDNSRIVLELIAEARRRGAAIVGIFHDIAVRRAVATCQFDIAEFQAAA